MEKMLNWFMARDYAKAKDVATETIVKRQSRGNVFSQNGWSMSKSELDKNSKEADRDLVVLGQYFKKVA